MEENKKPKNPPAFAAMSASQYSSNVQKGMDLRDYFAAKAMQSFLSNCGKYNLLNTSEIPLLISKDSYKIADTMLKQREL